MDELSFNPSGKCKFFQVAKVEATLKVTYASGTIRLVTKQDWWNGTEKEKLTFHLPKSIAYVKSLQLSGTFEYILVMKPDAVIPPGTEPTMAMFNLVHGYKIQGGYEARNPFPLDEKTDDHKLWTAGTPISNGILTRFVKIGNWHQ